MTTDETPKKTPRSRTHAPRARKKPLADDQKRRAPSPALASHKATPGPETPRRQTTDAAHAAPSDYSGRSSRPTSPSGPHDPRRRLWLWLTIGGVVLVALVAIFFARRHKEEDHQAKGDKKGGGGVPAVTAQAHLGDMDVYLEALGAVTPVYTVHVTSRVQGQITVVNFKEGQMVHKGDALVEIDPNPYRAALLQAQGHLAHDQAVLKQAKLNLARYRSAFEQKVVPAQQYEDQEQIVAQDEGSVKEDQGALAAAQVNLDFCHITSPIDGRVGLRQVDSGNMVDGSGTKILAVITQLQPIDVVFSIAEDHLDEVLAEVQAGHALTTDIYDRTQQNKIATGTLLTLDNVVDPTTGTVKLKAESANDKSTLFPSQFVNVRLRVTTEKGQTLVATPAIQRNVQGTFVYVVKSDQTVEMRPVKVGAANDKDMVVTGVKPGETVVTAGFDKLQEGAKIIPEAPAAPSAAKKPDQPHGGASEAH